MKADLVLRSRRVITPGSEAALCIVVSNGVITALEPWDAPPADTPLVDAGDDVLMPGLIDTHVHLNEPGREDWEGFETGTRAAAAGGITTLVDMPLNSIPATTTARALEQKRSAARGRCCVDVGFWGGIVPDGDAGIDALWDAGVLGFKCFIAPSGVPEFPHVTTDDLVRVLPLLAAHGAPLLVHAELPSLLQQPAGDPLEYATWLGTRPAAAEVEAVRALVELCGETRLRTHVVHVAAADVLPLLDAAHADALPITAETCPHYLFFAAEEIPRARTEFKCAPPIRTAEHRDALWRGLLDGSLSLIASDHSPAPPDRKRAGGSFIDAWGGIASLQLTLSAVWTAAAQRAVPLARLAEWLAAAPARLAGLPQKGALEVGRDADIIVFDPDTSWTVRGESLLHRHPLTPYEGQRLRGTVRSTYLRGERIFDVIDGYAPARGELLARPPAPAGTAS